MALTIIFTTDARQTVSVPWDRGLPAAKLHATDQVTMKKALAAEIRDDTGKLVFTYGTSPKRPSDLNQAAKRIVDIATGDEPNDSPKGD